MGLNKGGSYYESPSKREEDVREVQGCAPRGGGSRDLREKPEAQTATRMTVSDER
jgi:hypothetical protein